MGGKPDRDRGRKAWLLPTLGIAVILQLVVVNAWLRFPSPNERSHVYQALALVDRGALSVDDEVRRFGGMEDLASAGGHLYPNKAPGLLPLLVPGAALAHALAAGDAGRELTLALVLGRLLASSVPFLVTVVLLASIARPRDEGSGELAVAAYALASPALAASVLAFSHALTACLLLGAWLILVEHRAVTVPSAAAAGLLLGWAAISEYPVVLPGAVVALAVLPRLRARRVVALVIGGAVPLLALALYDVACFGSAFSLSTGHEASGAFAAVAGHGLFGVSWPTPTGLVGQLTSPARGLLVWSPLLLAAPLAWGQTRSGSNRTAAVRIGTVASLILWVVLAGYPNWHGGWFPGPRYLLPVLPLLFVAVAAGVERVLARPAGRTMAVLAVVWGWWMVWPVLASFPFPPEDFPTPAVTLAIPLLREGIHTPSWLPAGIVLPAMCILAVTALAVPVALVTRSSGVGERAVAAALSAALIAASLLVSPPSTWRSRLEMAVIHDVYAGEGRTGALERLRQQCQGPAQCAGVAAWIARRDGAPAGK
ncbi:MAG: hypothetical protein ACM3O7_03980 [Acidobacteriota bacterium]